MEQPDATLEQLRELLNRYTQPCADDCDHSHCPLLRELHALHINRTLEQAQCAVRPIVDRERAGESVGDLMNMRLDSRASVAAVEGDGLADVVQSYINEIRERFRGVSDGTWKSTAIAIVDELEQKLITHQVDQYAPTAASSPAPAEPWRDQGGHPWEIKQNITCVECPHCCFTFAAEHTDGYSNGYSCPNCQGCSAPAEPLQPTGEQEGNR